jgi:diacylglycerol kinase family enzyme
MKAFMHSAETRRVTVILNTKSGTGCPADSGSRLQQKFAAAGMRALVRCVQRGEHIATEVRHAITAGDGTVVAAGGDGTVSAVATGLVGSSTCLGVLPMGTLNHFAKDVGIPIDEDAAIRVIAFGRTRSVDAGEVNGRLFINNSSLGLYPDIVRERNKRQGRLGHGKWRALIDASINAARRYPLLDVQIELDGAILTRSTPFVFVGNNAYAMEGFEIGKRDALDSGQLSLYLTQRMGRFGLLQLAFMALVQRLQQARDFDALAAREFTVHTRHRHLRVSTDGEVMMMQTPLHYRIRPGALTVMVPGDDGDAP